MKEMKTGLNCKCNGMFLDVLFEYDKAPKGETSFVLKDKPYSRCFKQCRVCGHAKGEHSFELDGLYENEYIQSTYGGRKGLIKRFEYINSIDPKDSDNYGRVCRVLSHANSLNLNGKRLLDIGSGIGVFPFAMKKAGWDVIGIETDPVMVDHLQSFVGIDCLCSHIAELDENAIGRFDVITLNKVLEHVEQPWKLLHESRRFLDSNGFIYIELPDICAADAGKDREEFFIEHWHVFSPASLDILSKSSGFSLQTLGRLIEPSGKYTLFACMAKKDD